MFVFATNDPKVLDAYKKGMMDAKNMGATKPKAPSKADLEALVKQAERIDKDALKMSVEHDLMPRLTGEPGFKPFGEEDYEELVSVYTYLIRCYQLGHAINSKMIRLWRAATDVPATDDVELPPADVDEAIEKFQAEFLRPVAEAAERVKAKLDELQNSMAGITDWDKDDDEDDEDDEAGEGEDQSQPEPSAQQTATSQDKERIQDTLTTLVREAKKLDKAANKLCADHDLFPRLRQEPGHDPFNEENFGELLSVYTYLLRYYRLGELVKQKMIRLEGAAESIAEAGDTGLVSQVLNEMDDLLGCFLKPLDKAISTVRAQLKSIMENAGGLDSWVWNNPDDVDKPDQSVAMVRQALEDFPELCRMLDGANRLHLHLVASGSRAGSKTNQRLQEEQVRLQLEATKLDRDISKVTTAHDLLPRLFHQPGYKPFDENSFDELVGLYTYLVRAIGTGTMVCNKMERVWKAALDAGDKALADRADKEHDELVLNFLDPVKVIYSKIDDEVERILSEVAYGPEPAPDKAEGLVQPDYFGIQVDDKPDQAEIQALVQRVMDEFKAKAESRHQKEAAQDADLAKRVLDDLQKDAKPKA